MTKRTPSAIRLHSFLFILSPSDDEKRKISYDEREEETTIKYAIHSITLAEPNRTVLISKVFIFSPNERVKKDPKTSKITLRTAHITPIRSRDRNDSSSRTEDLILASNIASEMALDGLK